jgi:hypothetical protein
MGAWESTREAPTPPDTPVCARERRRRKIVKNAMVVRITSAATPPTIVPAMAAVFDLLPPILGDPSPEEGVEDAPGENVECTLEDVGVTDVETPEGPRIQPGETSGESIKQVGKSIVGDKKKDRGDDAHHRRHSICRGSNCPQSGVCCE